MTVFIALLRGINVSGHNPLKMEALGKMFAGLGFANIKTYVQSGNVVFVAQENKPKKIADEIAKAIKSEFDYEVPVLILSAEELKEAIEKNPFLTQTAKEPNFCHFTFLAENVDEPDIKEIEAKKQQGEEFSFSDKVVYLYCPHGYGKTKLNNQFFEQKLKVPATTRNLKTTNKLLELATEINL